MAIQIRHLRNAPKYSIEELFDPMARVYPALTLNSFDAALEKGWLQASKKAYRLKSKENSNSCEQG